MASAIFITDLQGRSIISRNYRGDVPLTKAIERFAKYLVEVEDESKKPIFYVDVNSDVQSGDEVGTTGPGGDTFVYVQASRCCSIHFANIEDDPGKAFFLEKENHTHTILCSTIVLAKQFVSVRGD